jgi:hypothetical protein
VFLPKILRGLKAEKVAIYKVIMFCKYILIYKEFL